MSWCNDKVGILLTNLISQLSCTTTCGNVCNDILSY